MTMTISGHGRKTDKEKEEENERLAQVDAYVVERGAPLEDFPPPKRGIYRKIFTGLFTHSKSTVEMPSA